MAKRARKLDPTVGSFIDMDIKILFLREFRHVKIPTIFISRITLEHGLNKDGTPKALINDGSFETFFQDAGSGQYVPRSIFVDLEPTVIDSSKTI